MTITIRLFALGRELVGANTLEYSFAEDGDSGSGSPVTVADVLQRLQKEHTALARLPSFLVAVNSEYAERTRPLCDGDELAIIPPVSGG
jgi:molybdopterin converting factor small subunit